jgi:hypothetical protein
MCINRALASVRRDKHAAKDISIANVILIYDKCSSLKTQSPVMKREPAESSPAPVLLRRALESQLSRRIASAGSFIKSTGSRVDTNRDAITAIFPQYSLRFFMTTDTYSPSSADR